MSGRRLSTEDKNDSENSGDGEDTLETSPDRPPVIMFDQNAFASLRKSLDSFKK